MTTAEAVRSLDAFRPRDGHWTRVERARGSGHRCDVCRVGSITRGFAFFENDHTSTAFVCDPCATAIARDA